MELHLTRLSPVRLIRVGRVASDSVQAERGPDSAFLILGHNTVASVPPKYKILTSWSTLHQNATLASGYYQSLFNIKCERRMSLTDLLVTNVDFFPVSFLL